MPPVVVAAKRCAIVALAIGYILLAHFTNATPGNENLGAFIALAPILLAFFSMAWRSPHRRVGLPLVVLGCIGLWAAWGVIAPHYSRLYWLEHAGTQTVLCLVFARTLGRAREPMCTTFARMVHGVLTPVMLRYTRQVTIAWVGFFAAMALTSTTLFVVAPLETWSIFANFFTAPLICSMFIAEYAVRRMLHPTMDHAPILAAVKAFWTAPTR